MQQYKDLLHRVMTQGQKQDNRTGVPAISKAGDMMTFDLTQGFPVPTLRKAAWKGAVGEMIAFINGADNAASFRDLKCKFWDDNANNDGLDINDNPVPNKWLTNPNRKGEDDLGEVYGKQWREWLVSEKDGERVVLDQFKGVIESIMKDPTSRRMLVSAWRPDRFDKMALPPCHVMFQFLANVEKRELNLNMFIRSNDLFLGAPANIVEYAFLLTVVAMATGYKAKTFNYFIGDAHIYENHVEQVNTMLDREPQVMPRLVYHKEHQYFETAEEAIAWMEGLHPDDFTLEDYYPHPPLSGRMAV